MKCMTCQEEVSQKFLHAVATNICPFCGQNLMPLELQTCLNNLRTVMTEIGEKAFLKQAQDWLRSNFDLVATDSDEYVKREDDFNTLQASFIELTETFQQVKTELDEIKKRPQANTIKDPSAIKMALDEHGKPIQLKGESLQNAETSNMFMQRAYDGIQKTNKNPDELRKLANKIKTTQGNQGMVASIMNVSDDDVDPYAQEEYEDDEEMLDPIGEQLAMLGNGGSNLGGGMNALPKTLQHKKATAAKRALSSGGSVGLISRTS
jgi:hypothetical protein